MKSVCQERADDMLKAPAAGRPLVDKSKKVAALPTTGETPQVASVTLAPDFDGYLFAITMDSSWSDTLCSLVHPPTALARRRANTTPMSHGLSVFLLVDAGSASTGCPSAIDFGQFRLRPISSSANFDFGQFLDVEFWDHKGWVPRRVGPPRVEPPRVEPRRVEPRRVGGPKGEAPKGGAQKGWGPKRGGPKPRKSGAPKGGAQKGGAQKGGAPKGGGPKILRFFFPPPATIFILLFLSWGPFVEFWWCLKRRGLEMCTFGVLGLSCASPGGPVWAIPGRVRVPSDPSRLQAGGQRGGSVCSR